MMEQREDNRDYQLFKIKKGGAGWATTTVVYKGSAFTAQDLSEDYGISVKTITYRLRCMLPFEMVVSKERLKNSQGYYPAKNLDAVLTDAIQPKVPEIEREVDYTTAYVPAGFGKPSQIMTYQGETFFVVDRAKALGLDADVVRYRVRAKKMYDEVFASTDKRRLHDYPHGNSKQAKAEALSLESVMANSDYSAAVLFTRNEIFPAQGPAHLYNADHLYAAANSEQGVAA